MPHRRPSANATTAAAPGGDFRKRYDAVEARREKLMARLRRLGANTQAQPGYKRAIKLLNDTFRKTKLGQRAAVLESAAWLIDLLERLPTGL
jgi:predicted RNA polymerase sigma factor